MEQTTESKKDGDRTAGISIMGKDRSRTFDLPLSHIEEFEIYKERGQHGYKLRCSLSRMTEEIEQYFRDEFGATYNPTEFSDKKPGEYLGIRSFDIETADNSNVVRRRIMDEVIENGESRKHVSKYNGRKGHTKFLPAEETEIEYNGKTVCLGSEDKNNENGNIQ